MRESVGQLQVFLLTHVNKTGGRLQAIRWVDLNLVSTKRFAHLLNRILRGFVSVL